MRVLVIEDDPSVSEFLEKALTADGYQTECVFDGSTGRDVASRGSHEIILMDIMLPGMDGLQVCRELRAAGVKTPVIFLSAKGTLDDKVHGLDAGADDYLPKPFEVAELLARVRANLRRQSTVALQLKVGPIRLDPLARTVHIHQQELWLSPTEFALLEQLMRSSGRTVSRVAIMRRVWKQDYYDDKVIDVYISGLRKKLGEHGQLIRTDRGVGYRIESGEPST